MTAGPNGSIVDRISASVENLTPGGARPVGAGRAVLPRRRVLRRRHRVQPGTEGEAAQRRRAARARRRRHAAEVLDAPGRGARRLRPVLPGIHRHARPAHPDGRRERQRAADGAGERDHRRLAHGDAARAAGRERRRAVRPELREAARADRRARQLRGGREGADGGGGGNGGGQGNGGGNGNGNGNGGGSGNGRRQRRQQGNGQGNGNPQGGGNGQGNGGGQPKGGTATGNDVSTAAPSPSSGQGSAATPARSAPRLVLSARQGARLRTALRTACTDVSGRRLRLCRVELRDARGRRIGSGQAKATSGARRLTVTARLTRTGRRLLAVVRAP